VGRTSAVVPDPLRNGRSVPLPSRRILPNIRTGLGTRRAFEISAVAWLDLLGYGDMLRAANFDPSSSHAAAAVQRLRAFHGSLEQTAYKYLPVFALNDGAAAFRDLSTRARSVSFDFLARAIDLYDRVNATEAAAGHPGARMIVAVGPANAVSF
jgi:hypothetical protein